MNELNVPEDDRGALLAGGDAAVVPAGQVVVLQWRHRHRVVGGQAQPHHRGVHVQLRDVDLHRPGEGQRLRDRAIQAGHIGAYVGRDLLGRAVHVPALGYRPGHHGRAGQHEHGTEDHDEPAGPAPPAAAPVGIARVRVPGVVHRVEALGFLPLPRPRPLRPARGAWLFVVGLAEQPLRGAALVALVLITLVLITLIFVALIVVVGRLVQLVRVVVLVKLVLEKTLDRPGRPTAAVTSR